MKLQIIKRKYPKAFQTFIVKRKDIIYLSADVRSYWKEITEFMDKQEIFITIEKPCVGFNFYVWDELSEKHESDYDYLFRDKAETLAIEKAFQILEERLQETGK